MNIKGKPNQRDAEMETMKFVRKEITFYPEDIKKMEVMEHDEKMAYMKELKQKGKYTVFE